MSYMHSVACSVSARLCFTICVWPFLFLLQLTPEKTAIPCCGLSACMAVCLSVCLLVCLSVRLSVSPSDCMSVRTSGIHLVVVGFLRCVNIS